MPRLLRSAMPRGDEPRRALLRNCIVPPAARPLTVGLAVGPACESPRPWGLAAAHRARNSWQDALPAPSPTLYAAHTDIVLVRELPAGRAEVPLCFEAALCRRQASYLSRTAIH